MKPYIAVLGLGYVGLTLAVSLARRGHTVRGYDVDPQRMAELSAGRAPVREPGLDAALAEALAAARLQFVPGPGDALSGAGVIFICAGTPVGPDGRPDLSQVLAAADAVAAARPGADTVLAVKSSVPPGTSRRLQQRLLAQGTGHVHVASNPEFLRQGAAMRDMEQPARIIIGTESDLARARLGKLYAPLGVPIVYTDPASAELIKYGANAFLAMRISFANILADLCEVVGGDVATVTGGIGLDPRIGPDYLHAGAGYGGSCLPKDLAGLVHTLDEHGVDPGLFRAVEAVNAGRVRRILDKLVRHLPALDGAEVALLGLAFKPGTDDVRSAPSQVLARTLLARGAHLRLHDPWAGPAFARLFPVDPPRIRYAPDVRDAVAGADAAILVTEWPEYRAADPADWAPLMRFPLLVDARNLFTPDGMAGRGLIYESFGRPGTEEMAP